MQARVTRSRTNAEGGEESARFSGEESARFSGTTGWGSKNARKGAFSRRIPAAEQKVDVTLTPTPLPESVTMAHARVDFVLTDPPAAECRRLEVMHQNSHQTKSTSKLLQLVQEQACVQPDAEFCVWLNNKAAVSDSRTFGELWQRAESVAIMLAQKGVAKGDRVVMCFNFGLGFLDAFLGCLRLGAIAVPLYPPNPVKLVESLAKLALVVSDCGAKFGLLDKSVNTLRATTKGWPKEITWFVPITDERSASVSLQLDSRTDDDVAFLQYTSGSTGDPKGVALTFGNIYSNMELNNEFEPRLLDTVAKGCSWLPQFHDMGLLAATLYPLARGRRQVFMSPTEFLKQPVLWLEAMSRFRCTWTTAPNFSYGLAARKFLEIPPERRPGLDLSRVVSLCNAAEPVRLETMQHFAAAFSSHGLHNASWFPSYGLAEHTVLGTTCPLHIPGELSSLLDRSGRYVACGDLEMGGRAERLVDVRIVSQDGEEVEDGTVGEIWMRSASCGAGYWGQEERSQETFRASLKSARSEVRELEGLEGPRAGYWMRAGDEGFVEADPSSGKRRLYVAGRIKDVIIVRGKNLYPQDVELTAEQAGAAALRLNCSAAYQSQAEDGSDLAAADLVCELKGAGMPENQLAALCDVIVAAVRTEHSLAVRRLLLIRPRTIPKTTSGKIRRKETAAQVRSGRLGRKALMVWENLALESSSERETHELEGAEPSAPDQGLPTDVEGFERLIAQTIATAAELEEGEEVNLDEPMFELGLESIAGASLAQTLSERLGLEVGPQVVLSADTVRALAHDLWGRLQEQSDGDSSGVDALVDADAHSARSNSQPSPSSRKEKLPLPSPPPSSDSQASGAAAVLVRGAVQVALICWLLLSLYLCSLPAVAVMERITKTDMFPFVLFRSLVEPKAFEPAEFRPWGAGSGLGLSDIPAPDKPLFSSSWVGVPLGMVCAAGVFILSFGAYVVALKWTVLGRVKEGDYALWGWLYWRRWLVQRHVEVLSLVCSPLLQDAAPLSVLYTLLGARVGAGSDAVLQAADVDFDLLTVGRCASVSSSACVITALVSDNTLHLRRVHVGERCVVGESAVLCPGVHLPARSCVKPKSVVTTATFSSGSEGLVVEGSPAQPVAGASFCGSAGQGIFDTIILPVCWMCCLLLESALCLMPVVAVHTWALEGTQLSGLAMVAVAVGYMALFLLSLCMATLATKWGLLGRRLRAGGVVGRGSALALARECVHRLDALVGRFVLSYVWGGELITWWYRAMGARLGRGVLVSIGVGMSDWDSVDVGDMVLLGGGCALKTSEVDGESGDRTIKGVQIGEGSAVGMRARVGAGSKVGKRGLVTSLSYVLPGSELEEHCVVVGNKATRRQKSCYVPREGLPRSVPLIRELSTTVLHVGWTCLAVWAALYLVWWLRTTWRLPAALLFPLGGGAYQLGQLLAAVVCKWTVARRPRGEEELVLHRFGEWWRQYAQVNLDNAYAYSLLGQSLRGGPLANLLLNCLGASVHRDAYIGSSWIYDYDQLEIAQRVAVNAAVNLTPHVVMSCACATVPRVAIGAGATLWPQAVCIGRTWVPPGTHVGPETRMVMGTTALVGEEMEMRAAGGQQRMLLGVPGKVLADCGLDSIPTAAQNEYELPV